MKRLEKREVEFRVNGIRQKGGEVKVKKKKYDEQSVFRGGVLPRKSNLFRNNGNLWAERGC